LQIISEKWSFTVDVFKLGSCQLNGEEKIGNILQKQRFCITMPAMISLIINADDLGSNIDRDRGILKAYKQGIVTSASLLANGPSFTTAVAQAKETGLPVGVHLNLADGTTLAGPIKGLTDSAGRLPGKQKLRQCLANGACDHSAIRMELAAQIERTFIAGLQPDHLDSHQHCQLFPCLTTIVTELAKEYDIPAIRMPLPAEPTEQDPKGALGKELALYRTLAPDAHRIVMASGLTTTGGLWGMPLLGRLDTTSLCQLLENIPQGCWEIMAHPGYPYAQGGPFDGEQRLLELHALLSSEAQEIIVRRNIRLQTFGELPCAS
jgi:predicted glycoside hydrolase/deacetylase ChbG (UPF0249 family)